MGYPVVCHCRTYQKSNHTVFSDNVCVCVCVCVCACVFTTQNIQPLTEHQQSSQRSIGSHISSLCLSSSNTRTHAFCFVFVPFLWFHLGRWGHGCADSDHAYPNPNTHTHTRTPLKLDRMPTNGPLNAMGSADDGDMVLSSNHIPKPSPPK